MHFSAFQNCKLCKIFNKCLLPKWKLAQLSWDLLTLLSMKDGKKFKYFHKSETLSFLGRLSNRRKRKREANLIYDKSYLLFLLSWSWFDLWSFCWQMGAKNVTTFLPFIQLWPPFTFLDKSNSVRNLHLFQRLDQIL